MKKLLSSILLSGIVAGFFACRGECVRCSKAGSQSLSYCENDFPNNDAFKNQLTGLDSAGYTCTPK